ncbi:MAG TPA: hemolysin III family protein [Candidatus Avimonas sp.]|nr:hemolysin III family protein [Clostridiales bacterium]HOB37042.1 hemolysin III family protein [Candidatus Avimonas sp.]HQA16658.1 hemolysin III family protein [Candidatus Avimonas sp.]HQD38469.1 hemolysin III family protein [Candidatus Avimonas sp.]
MSVKTKTVQPLYSIGEEIGNAITHGIAATVSIGGIAVLVLRAGGRALETAAVAVYGLSMLLAFSMSTLYHALTNQKAKRVLRVLDHASIYLLIAGTYTPFTLIILKGAVGWIIAAAVWCTAVFGIILKLISVDRFKKISMACYVSAGWCILAAIRPICKNLPLAGLLLLFAGGLFYTTGLIFYSRKKIRYMHTAWHIFVLAGAALHYFCVLLYVL